MRELHAYGYANAVVPTYGLCSVCALGLTAVMVTSAHTERMPFIS
jgi:hypothetical protein